MELITKRTKIRDVPGRYRRMYWREDHGWQEVRKGRGLPVMSSELVYDRLKHLDVETCSEEDIAGIIGNDSWTMIRCDECGRSVERAVVFGSGREGCSLVCHDCIAKAVGLLEGNDERG
jgi:hypothetical protein